MAKIKLGNRPKTFKPFPVRFTMPDGEKAVVEVTFKYRTRGEFGVMMNAMFNDAGETAPDGGKTDFEALFQKMGDKNADHLLASIDAWNMDEPLTHATLLALSDEIPAASVALMTAYNEACTQGRLGN